MAGDGYLSSDMYSSVTVGRKNRAMGEWEEKKGGVWPAIKEETMSAVKEKPESPLHFCQDWILAVERGSKSSSCHVR